MTSSGGCTLSSVRFSFTRCFYLPLRALGKCGTLTHTHLRMSHGDHPIGRDSLNISALRASSLGSSPLLTSVDPKNRKMS